ncbi:hypothetical protein N7G274_009188 [Stereocaulon virgatum]|uniref:Solute carrier family 40 member n=1 Tax=Stereocaulon virgatum TaxID=373712 RepID=A0ABR3ZZK7_9LECA
MLDNAQSVDFAGLLVNEIDSSVDDEGHDTPFEKFTGRQAYRLYVSHSLSMWNSRMYEFSVILFIQAAFPENLRASSINGIAETICVLFFSGALGRWVDRNPSRLQALLLTITINRITVLVSCITWFFILSISNSAQKYVLFAIALFLGMVEKLSRGTNILCMERDWVPTLANPCVDASSPMHHDLTHLNTIMRRIDMLCKLIAPLAVSTFVSTVGSQRIAAAVVALTSTSSWALERGCAHRVWKQNGRLRVRKDAAQDTGNGNNANNSMQLSLHGYRELFSAHLARDVVLKTISEVVGSSRAYVSSLQDYFRSAVWIPSVCAAIPHASVLTFSGTMITYLLNAGLSLKAVTGARASGAIFEIGSTFMFPWAVGILSPETDQTIGGYGTKGYNRLDAGTAFPGAEDHSPTDVDQDLDFKQGAPDIENGVVRVGCWSICFLCLSLIPTLLSLFYLNSTLPNPTPTPTTPTSPMKTHPVAVLLLILFISISLLFRWTYDLCATQLTQTLVPAAQRSSFGGTEMSVVSMISLVHWVAAAVWSMQSDFKWLAMGSFVMIGIAGGAYFGWQRWWQGGGKLRSYHEMWR